MSAKNKKGEGVYILIDKESFYSKVDTDMLDKNEEVKMISGKNNYTMYKIEHVYDAMMTIAQKLVFQNAGIEGIISEINCFIGIRFIYQNRKW